MRSEGSGKRPAEESAETVVKAPRVESAVSTRVEDGSAAGNLMALSTIVHSRNSALMIRKEAAERTSSLSAPNLQLEGHSGAVYSLAFDPSGKNLASSSMDRSILLWDVMGQDGNYNALRGHKNAVLQVTWPTESRIFSASADRTGAAWDANRGIKTRSFVAHAAIVNTIASVGKSGDLAVTGSDDCTAVLWDVRQRPAVATFHHEYQVTAVAASPCGTYIYTGGLDNIIRRFDTRLGTTEDPELMMLGCADTITGLAVSPDGTQLLSNSMDCQLRLWDARPFAAGMDITRPPIRAISGVHHGAEKLLLRCSWSADGEYFTCGSADRVVHMWEANTYREVGTWGGHAASVNEVIFHPNEPIIASASSDRSIILSEFTN